MRRRALLRLGGAAFAGALAGCSGGGSGPARVEMTDDLRFDPATVRVEVGAAVEWTNVGSIQHTVTAYEGKLPVGAAYFASGGFDSEAAARGDLSAGLIDGGGSYRHTFEIAGTYTYYCIPHEGAGMTGTVRVE